MFKSFKEKLLKLYVAVRLLFTPYWKEMHAYNNRQRRRRIDRAVKQKARMISDRKVKSYMKKYHIGGRVRSIF